MIILIFEVEVNRNTWERVKVRMLEIVLVARIRMSAITNDDIR